MHSRVSLVLVAVGCWSCWAGDVTIGGSLGAWPRILAPVGLEAKAGETGNYLILEGDSDAARMLGFRATQRCVRVLSVEETRRPQLKIVWEHPADVPVFQLPPEAVVFTRERWSGAPLVAGLRRGAGGILWVAVAPGERGYERFPYLLAALSELGLSPPYRSHRLWAFFDSSYRTRADVDYLADRWRLAGIRGLHVAAWHYYEPDPERDEYLRRLVESCHRRGILVYAWLELPHVSEKFWTDHPEWREKTALLQDAHLDWRRLMNLASRDCFAAASAGVLGLLERFDWDGVNLAELYFESLQGHENPSRFTPMNDDVRREFRGAHGFDPVDLFNPASPRHFGKDASSLRAFLDFRAELSRRIQTQWMERLESARRSKPDLEIVLTHVDDRFDSRMRDAIGADAGSVLPMLDRHRFTFLIEDPATVWNLGPERYREIARQYAALTPRQDCLAIDLNIVERYQDVYPTKQQTGTELYQLIGEAARAFPRVALYFENSIQAQDAAWLASAGAAVVGFETDGRKTVVEAPYGAGIRWKGTALVDGRPWPVQDGETVWLPAGRHSLEPASQAPRTRLLDLTGELLSAASSRGALEFAYRSSARAYAILDKPPGKVKIDGAAVRPLMLGLSLALPSGRHSVRVEAE